MTWAPTETQKTIFTTLSNDVDLCTLLGTTVGGAQKIFDHVPDVSPYPYVKIEIKPTNQRDNEAHDGVEILYVIKVWNQGADKGDLKVQQIQARIDKLLNRKDICIDGWNVIAHNRTSINIMDEPDGRTKQGIQIFKLLLGGLDEL